MAATVATALVGALTSACSGDGAPDADGGGCASFEVVDSQVAKPALVIEPRRAQPGEDVEVARVDGATMDFASAFLYADEHAGCRTFALTLGMEGTDWKDVTGQRDMAIGGTVSPGASESYPVPSTARHGNYVLCVLVLGNGVAPAADVCGRFEV